MARQCSKRPSLSAGWSATVNDLEAALPPALSASSLASRAPPGHAADRAAFGEGAGADPGAGEHGARDHGGAAGPSASESGQ